MTEQNETWQTIKPKHFPLPESITRECKLCDLGVGHVHDAKMPAQEYYKKLLAILNDYPSVEVDRNLIKPLDDLIYHVKRIYVETN